MRTVSLFRHENSKKRTPASFDVNNNRENIVAYVMQRSRNVTLFRATIVHTAQKPVLGLARTRISVNATLICVYAGGARIKEMRVVPP